MKKLSVVLVLTVLGLATLGSAAVMQFTDSNDDGVIEGQVSEMRIGTKDLNAIVSEGGTGAAAAWYELQVQAEGNEANADPGDSDNANILVLVTYEGMPVDFLTESDFALKTILVPPGKGAVKVKSFSNSGNGAYAFQVVPIKSITWGAGEYDIQLSVSYAGVAVGQTIASIEVT